MQKINNKNSILYFSQYTMLIKSNLKWFSSEINQSEIFILVYFYSFYNIIYFCYFYIL